MSSSVELYVYDLSNGMAKQLSRQLTGKQIDGIWHTSVVVFGKEIFYGQGISITRPGRSHHGSPLEIIHMGETAIDEETFQEYLVEIKEHYTADKYHLLEFNCNSFTNDCVGFLTGRSIPSHISELPTDFLSTPFGAALRPTIDAMYRRPSASTPLVRPPPTSATSQNPQLAASILQAVAANAQMNGSNAQQPADNPITAPMHIITNSPSFSAFLKTHRAAVAFFTSQTCPPCKMIEPMFEGLANEKGVREDRDGAGFAKIDLDVGMGNHLAGNYGVRATPTFIFFLDGTRVHTFSGADAGELRTQVDLLLFQAYPAHPHTYLSIPTIQALSLNPILFKQVPVFDPMCSKLFGFIDGATWPTAAVQTPSQIKTTLSTVVFPYLKSRFSQTVFPADLPSATPTILEVWSRATATLVAALPIGSAFPVVDMWRLFLLDPAVGNWISGSPQSPINLLLPKAIDSLQDPTKSSRNYTLTVLRMLANGFANPVLARWLMLGTVRATVTQVLVPSLLHEDAAVRTAAASLAFNAAVTLQKPRIDAACTGKRWNIQSEGEDTSDWEVEMVSAITEAIDREKENEEVVHRLAACLAFLLRLSPGYNSQLSPLLQVLQAKDILKGKLMKGSGWDADRGLAEDGVRRLVEEVANKLCP